jgi:hypothetical protein
MLTSINMRWAVGKSLPTVSYLTSIDKYSIGSVVIIVTQLLYHAFYGLINQNIPADISYWVDKGAFLLFLTLILLKQLMFVGWVTKITLSRRKRKFKPSFELVKLDAECRRQTNQNPSIEPLKLD